MGQKMVHWLEVRGHGQVKAVIYIYVLTKIHGQDESATGSKARYINGDKYLRILRGKKVIPLKQDMQVLSDSDQTCYKEHNIIILLIACHSFVMVDCGHTRKNFAQRSDLLVPSRPRSGRQ
jgi:hypothetical protein